MVNGLGLGAWLRRLGLSLALWSGLRLRLMV